jgi:hypothetical protein
VIVSMKPDRGIRTNTSTKRVEPLERLERLERSFLILFRQQVCGPLYVGHDEDFTILSFARFRCAIRDLALVAIFSAATSAFLIVCSILSGARPRRIRLSIIFFLRSDLAAFLICLASANISFGIFVIPFHYRVFIHGANLMAGLAPSHRDQGRSLRFGGSRRSLGLTVCGQALQ